MVLKYFIGFILRLSHAVFVHCPEPWARVDSAINNNDNNNTNLSQLASKVIYLLQIWQQTWWSSFWIRLKRFCKPESELSWFFYQILGHAEQGMSTPPPPAFLPLLYRAAVRAQTLTLTREVDHQNRQPGSLDARNRWKFTVAIDHNWEAVWWLFQNSDIEYSWMWAIRWCSSPFPDLESTFNSYVSG